MADAVLVLNAGSSSMKLGLFEITPAEPTLICKGVLDDHENVPRIVVTDAAGKPLFEKRRPGEAKSKGLLPDIFAWIEDYLAGGRLAAVGHRIVQGGRDFTRAVMIDEQILAALEALTPLAPLHQPRCHFRTSIAENVAQQRFSSLF